MSCEELGFDSLEKQDFATGDLVGDLGCLRRRCSHVLWGSGMGPLANCCPNCLPSMLILSHSWSILDHSCWDSRVSNEPRVFL